MNILRYMDAESIGLMLTTAIGDEHLEPEQLGQIVRSGSLECLDDETLGYVIAGAEGIEEALGQTILDSLGE